MRQKFRFLALAAMLAMTVAAVFLTGCSSRPAPASKESSAPEATPAPTPAPRTTNPPTHHAGLHRGPASVPHDSTGSSSEQVPVEDATSSQGVASTPLPTAVPLGDPAYHEEMRRIQQQQQQSVQAEARLPRHSAARPMATPGPASPRHGTGPTAAMAPAAIPDFPWPPPAASASVEIDRPLLVKPDAKASLMDVSNRLVKAFETAGYGEKSFFAVPDGFVMVSRLEQINADGSPAGDHRWSLDVAAYTHFSIAAYLRALFTAQTGHYRVVCFAVTPHPFPESDQKVANTEALAWLAHGVNVLPPDIGRNAYTKDFHCTALIYEFVKTPGDEPTIALPPGSLGGEAHLQGSGIAKALADSPPR